MLAYRHAHSRAQRFNETITLYFVTLELSHASIVLSCVSCSLTSHAMQTVNLICDGCRLLSWDVVFWEEGKIVNEVTLWLHLSLKAAVQCHVFPNT